MTMTALAWRTRFREALSCDLRSLAVFRIALGVYIVADTAARFIHLERHYTDSGIVPVPLARKLLEAQGYWSLHTLGGGVAFQVFLFSLTFIAGLSVLLGYRTFWATLAGYVLISSMHQRFAWGAYPGDFMARTSALASLLAPTGAMWSIDARRKPAGAVTHFGPGSVALTVFTVTFVFYAAVSKVGPSWREGTAAFWVLDNTEYGRHVLDWFFDKPLLIKLATWGVLVVEGSSVLLLTPLGVGRVRVCITLPFSLLLTTFLFSLDLWLFPFMMAGCIAALLPSWFWDSLVPRLPLLRARLRAPTPIDPPHASGARVPWARWGCAAVFCAVILQDHARKIGEAGYFNPAPVQPSAPVEQAIRALGIKDDWTIFRIPEKYPSGWDAIAGTLADGTRVNVFTGQPMDLTAPPLPGALVGGFRDKRMFLFLNWKVPTIKLRWDELAREQYQQIARYHCRESHGRLTSVEIWKVVHEMRPPPVLHLAPVPQNIFSMRCDQT